MNPEQILKKRLEAINFFDDIDPELKLFCKTIRNRLRNEEDEVIGLTGYPGCQPTGSKVLMSNGKFKNIEDINIGDEVISPQEDGTNIFSRITNNSSWYCNKLYDVIQLNRKKKKLYSCSNNHLIPMYKRDIPRINGIRKSKNKKWVIKNYTAEEYSKISNHTKQRIKVGFSSFLIEKFKDKKNCLIEPYTLGTFLGDGCFSSINKRKHIAITSGDDEIMEEISKYYPILKSYKKKGTYAKQYTFSWNSEFVKLLTEYGLEGKGSGDKFIPKEALYSDSKYRKRLLAGLVDSDGYYYSGGYEIVSKSKKLIEDIEFLVYSLGGRGYIRKIKKGIKKLNFVGEYYSIRFYLHDMKLPLQTERKKKNINSVYLSSNRLAIDSISSGEGLVHGIEIDSPSKLYITDNFMVTHNTGKSMSTTTISLLIDHKYSFKKNVCFIPTSKEIKDMYLNLPMYSVLHIDEASRGMHKQQWHDKIQQTLNTLYDTEREGHYLCSILIMPRFQNFTENFRNFRIKYWINIINRGIGICYIKDEDKDTKDPWHLDDNYKLKQKNWRGKQIFERQINDVIEMEKKTKNYFFWFKIPKIPDEIWEEYQDLKKQSRVDAREREEELDVESYKDRLNNEKMARWKQIKEMKDKANTHDEIAVMLGCSPQTIRRNLREMEAYGKMKKDDNFIIKKQINKDIPEDLRTL